MDVTAVLVASLHLEALRYLYQLSLHGRPHILAAALATAAGFVIVRLRLRSGARRAVAELATARYGQPDARWAR
jgi:hypothetical protein